MSQHPSPEPQDVNHFSGLTYFSHLGALGASDVHALRARASAALMAALQIANDQCVLELGCGTGKTLMRVAHQTGGARARIIGADFSPDMLAATWQRVRWAGMQHKVRLVRSHIGRVPLADGSVDRAYCESALCFHDEATATTALRNIFRILKSGGCFAANEAIWRESTSDERIADVYDRCLQHFGTCQGCPQTWRIHHWLEVMRSIGFEVTAKPLHEACAQAPHSLAHLSLMPLKERVFDPVFSLLRKLKPTVRAAAAHYDALYKLHAGEGATIEDWLFVLRKP